MKTQLYTMAINLLAACDPPKVAAGKFQLGRNFETAHQTDRNGRPVLVNGNLLGLPCERVDGDQLVLA